MALAGETKQASRTVSSSERDDKRPSSMVLTTPAAASSSSTSATFSEDLNHHHASSSPTPTTNTIDTYDDETINHNNPPAPSLAAQKKTVNISSTGSLAASASQRGSFRRKPSLEEAKAFGQKRRPHRMPDSSQPSGYRLARVGEMQDENTGAVAEEYNTWKTPLSGLDEFGLGISLYFRQLAVLSVLFLICGLVSVPAIYHNSRYSNPGSGLLVRGSAAGASRADLSFAYTSMVDFSVVILLVLFALVSRQVSATISARVDEAQQTAQDYSICVMNPPPDVHDAKVYQERFAEYGDVVAVTLALNNGRLLTAMAAKREIETRLLETTEGERMLEAEENGWGLQISPQPMWKKVLAAVGLYQDVIVLWRQREALQATIQEAAVAQAANSRVKRVFVTFNTELAQRRALQDMYGGIVQRLFRGRVLASSNPRAVFEGRVLLLEEAVEPNEVIWVHFQYQWWRRFLRFCVSVVCSGFLLLASYSSLEYYSGKGKGSIFSAVLISVINMLLPLFIKFFTTVVELPLSLTEQQSSILFKLVLARCANTAVLMYAVTSYKDMFADETMNSVMIILITDAILAPTLQALNLPQRITQRFLAPRAKTQSAMNAHFCGVAWHLAERYTEISKTIFVSVFWSSILPQGLFVTAIALAITFYSDRYALFRIWRRPPPLSGHLVTLSRHVLSFTILVHVIMARVFFSNWPYKDPSQRARCNLFFCRTTDAMTDAQRATNHFYSILSVIIFVVIVQQFMWGPAKSIINATRRHFYVAGQGAAIAIPYRKVFGIFAYVPTVDVKDDGSSSEKWLAANLVDVPRYLLPLAKGLEVEEHNLCQKKEMEAVIALAAAGEGKGEGGKEKAEIEIEKLFSTMQFFPPSEEGDKATAATDAMANVALAEEMEASGADPSTAGVVLAAALTPEEAAAAAAAEGGVAGLVTNMLMPQTQEVPLNVSQEARMEEESKVEAPLPEGWEKGVDAQGRETYFNLNTMEEQEERPVEAAGWSPYSLWGYLSWGWGK